MFCSLLAMSMFMTLAASQDTPGLTGYPALMDGENAGDKAGLRGTGSSSGVRLKAVKCIKPSTGVSGWVNDMVGGLATVAIATAGAGACIGSAGAACGIIATGAGAAMGLVTDAAIKNGVVATIGKQFPGSDDDLYITMGGRKVWPSYSDHDIGSQETVYPNIFRTGRPNICLMERDSGWFSSDDSLGCANTHKIKPGHVALMIASKKEGSVYVVEIEVTTTDPSAPKTYTNNWWSCFDDKNWCNVNGFMTGMYRNDARSGSSDGIFLLEQASSADAPSNLRGASSCVVANWWSSFDKKGWSMCNSGYYMRGMYRNSKSHGNGLHLIEQAHCCKPNAQKGGWGACTTLNVSKSFDAKGWSKCATGSYMTGLWRNDCDNLYCIEYFRCCKMGARADGEIEYQTESQTMPEDAIMPEGYTMPEDSIMPEDYTMPEDAMMPEDYTMPEAVNASEE